MKIIIKSILWGLFSTAFPTIAFAEQPTALYQINQNNKNLIDDWKNYKLIDKEALAKVDHEYKKFLCTRQISQNPYTIKKLKY